MFGFVRFVHQVRKVRPLGAWKFERHISASDFYSFPTRVKPRMQRSTLKPVPVIWAEIEIHDRRRAEAEIGSGNLHPVCGPEFRMCIDRVLIERGRVTHV